MAASAGISVAALRAFTTRGRKSMLACFAAGGLCGAGLSGYALAIPPASGRSSLSTIDPVSPTSLARTRSAAGQEPTFAPLLDLQLRKETPAAVAPGRGAFMDFSGGHSGDPVVRPGFGATEARFPAQSEPETWLHRVHREGVPIIRLWDSKAAWLSIGLNQRGKPGLWLVQKVR